MAAYVAHAKLQGFDGLHSFYLPNMKIINDAFTPSSAEVRHAERIVAAFEAARTDGNPAVVLDGKVILIHQYERARSVVEQDALIRVNRGDEDKADKERELEQ